MHRRTFGRLGWQVSEVGYGTWGMGAWSGSDDRESLAALERAVELGCNFFDTAWVYGQGKSEQLLGRLLRTSSDSRLYVATKVPPRNMEWPARGGTTLDDTFPPEHIREYTERSLENLGVDCVDLQQLHTWHDDWVEDERWLRVADDLKREGLIRGFGISLNRWEPWNGLRAIASGAVDAVQVVYNIFDQAPEDELLPRCMELGVAVIARVPFDEGSLTGALAADSTWPAGDFRNIYFTKKNLPRTLERVEALRKDLPGDLALPEAALRFILHHPAVSTVIPGMRKLRHVEANLGASEKGPLDEALVARLRAHRWDRTRGDL